MGLGSAQYVAVCAAERGALALGINGELDIAKRSGRGAQGRRALLADLFYNDGSGHELWLADSLVEDDVRGVMGDRKADSLIFDAPFSEKTHSGHRGGKLTADRAAAWAKSANGKAAASANFKHEVAYAARVTASGDSGRNDLDYPAWHPADVAGFVALWEPLTAGWIVSITDDILAPSWRHELDACGRFAFPDGPSPWTVWIMVARPRTRTFASWGTLPGAYVQPAERDINSSGGSDRIVGGKPRKAMCRIVQDYSRRGDLVVDPTCGAGTTCMAAKMTGRRSIGIDTSAERLEIAARRLRDSREQRSLFDEAG
jgi:hypothetical protein